ncbi:hypothetical protein [Roseibium sp. M-1]
MSQPPKPSVGTTIAGFHAMATSRGDGLHPQLLAALGKSGSVSGPPAPSECTDENVVTIDFAANQRSVKRDRAGGQ